MLQVSQMPSPASRTTFSGRRAHTAWVADVVVIRWYRHKVRRGRPLENHPRGPSIVVTRRARRHTTGVIIGVARVQRGKVDAAAAAPAALSKQYCGRCFGGAGIVAGEYVTDRQPGPPARARCDDGARRRTQEDGRRCSSDEGVDLFLVLGRQIPAVVAVVVVNEHGGGHGGSSGGWREDSFRSKMQTERKTSLRPFFTTTRGWL